MTIGLASPAMADVVNGGFNAPWVSGSGYDTYPSTPVAFGWTVYSGTIDHGKHPGGTDCHSPPQCIDLNGNGPGAIKQSFATTAGLRYRVSFYMSRHRQLILSNVPATMNARINGNAIASFTHSVTGGTTATSGGWEPQYFDFTASGAQTELAFQSTTMHGMTGPQLDSVSVKALPRP